MKYLIYRLREPLTMSSTEGMYRATQDRRDASDALEYAMALIDKAARHYGFIQQLNNSERLYLGGKRVKKSDAISDELVAGEKMLREALAGIE